MPDKQDCLLPIGHNENTIEACNILVSVCKPLGESICPGSPNSTTCQQVITKDFGDNFYDMGGYQGNSEFVPLGKVFLLCTCHYVYNSTRPLTMSMATTTVIGHNEYS